MRKNAEISFFVRKVEKQNKNESRIRAKPLNSHPRAGSGRASVALALGPARAGFFQNLTPRKPLRGVLRGFQLAPVLITCMVEEGTAPLHP